MRNNGFKKGLPALPTRKFFHVCIITCCYNYYVVILLKINHTVFLVFQKAEIALAEAALAISAFLKNALAQINFKRNSKVFDYLY